jgi:hypothetical protein
LSHNCADAHAADTAAAANTGHAQSPAAAAAPNIIALAAAAATGSPGIPSKIGAAAAKAAAEMELLMAQVIFICYPLSTLIFACSRRYLHPEAQQQSQRRQQHH